MTKLRLADISVDATKLAKEQILDNKAVSAVVTIKNDFDPPLALYEAYDLYKRLLEESYVVQRYKDKCG